MDAMRERLIERGFPCHQVGAETLRERYVDCPAGPFRAACVVGTPSVDS